MLWPKLSSLTLLVPFLAIPWQALANVMSYPYQDALASPPSGPASWQALADHGNYTIMSHDRFPNHQVRIRKTEFCDPTVNVFTGYLDIDGGAKHLFFYFFESRRSPENDDVIMWINGGPGCSSSMGLLMELGPCNIDTQGISPNGTLWNPHSWNNEANIFFLDQPVGVGFSYADYGETIETTEDAAKNIYAFLTIFFQTFKELDKKPLHLAGESYGGRYLPVFASEIYDQNQVALKEGRPTINLKSIIIGNGITDISTLYEGRYEIECGNAAYDVPFQSISACVRMKKALPRCKKLMEEWCIDSFDSINCKAAVSFCDSELSTNMWDSGRNVYDISKPCIGDLCYNETAAITAYLNRPDIRSLLGVSSRAPPFESCSDKVGRGFAAHMDKWHAHTQDYVAALLDRSVGADAGGIRMLIYAGTYDWQCNWVANWRWVEKLEWSGREAFASVDWRKWGVVGAGARGVRGGGVAAGEVKQTEVLTFVTVRGAGHMVPFDKPAESFAMLSRWLKGEDI
ncbi:hypothetical protein AX16_005001 [Volvariella volvacea WC 439]|nr:hypothetical protein AX16_005001 [Volvariella volvacea WC 439]